MFKMVVLASMVCSSGMMASSQFVHFQQPHKLILPNITPITITNNSSKMSCQFVQLSSHTASLPRLSAVAADTTQPSSADKDQTTQKYYFLVANAKFMLDEEEHFQEVLFERRRLFGERNKEQDFWLVVEPKFLDKFPNITKRLKRPAVALVSTNGTWITFMKLRLDRVLADSFEADSLEEALASNPVKIEFEKPANWVAPYKKYEYGWWETFLPPESQKPEA